MDENFALGLLVVFAVVGVVTGFMLLRNHCAFKVEIHILGDKKETRDRRWARYASLPRHEDMVFNPRYWLLWTPGQWMAWLDKKAGKD
jgi:hypothetical protein